MILPDSGPMPVVADFKYTPVGVAPKTGKDKWLQLFYGTNFSGSVDVAPVEDRVLVPSAGCTFLYKPFIACLRTMRHLQAMIVNDWVAECENDTVKSNPQLYEYACATFDDQRIKALVQYYNDARSYVIELASAKYQDC
jgi:hypothetical protein